jgi:hypothetical protein
MSRAREDIAAPSGVTLATLVGALVAVLLPSLLFTASDTAGLVTIVVLALAVAALAGSGVRCVNLAAGAVLSGPRRRDRLSPVLPDRATDPVHHPLRPRAPGTA